MKKRIWKQLLSTAPVAVLALALAGCASTPKEGAEAPQSDEPAQVDEASSSLEAEGEATAAAEHPHGEHPHGDHPQGDSPD